MSTTMPALFTVLVGDDPVRRVATRDWRDDYWVCDAGGSWFPLIDKPRDVQPFIPDGTPVDRIVVLPEVAEVTVDTEGYWHVGDEAIGLEDRGVYPFDVRLHQALVTAAKMTKILAARAAEPTPDPLAQAKELHHFAGMKFAAAEREFRAANAEVARLLAATEGEK
jgi:hypothetical protein